LIGKATDSAGAVSFLWNRYHGMRSLPAILQTTFGIDLTGWSLYDARAISADGRVIVGTGIDPLGNTQAWRVTMPRFCQMDVNRDYRVDLDDLARLLANFGITQNARYGQGDIDLDGDVDLDDLAGVLSSFGTICD